MIFTIAFWKARTETWLLLLYLGGQGQLLEETMCNCVSDMMHKDISDQPHQHNDLQPFVRNWCSVRFVFCFSREWDLNPFAYWGRFHQSFKIAHLSLQCLGQFTYKLRWNILLQESFDLGFSKAMAIRWPVFVSWQNLSILKEWMWWNTEVDRFRENLTTKNHQAKLEAYNWVVSICLKYVSLPWNMVNFPRRGASEPWAWREFYQA